MKTTPLARSLDQVVELGKAIAPAAERALKDPELRRALTATAIQARGLYTDARRDSARQLGGRLARDRRFQEELGELVRNAADTVDQARAPKKRHRIRRTLLWIAAIGGTVVIAMKFLKRGADDAPGDGPAATTSPNGVAHSPSAPGSQFASHQ